MGCDCYKAHVACNDFAAKTTPRQVCQMQSLKGHKITLIAVVDLLRWDNGEVGEPCLGLSGLRQMHDVSATDPVMPRLLVFAQKEPRITDTEARQ